MGCAAGAAGAKSIPRAVFHKRNDEILQDEEALIVSEISDFKT